MPKTNKDKIKYPILKKTVPALNKTFAIAYVEGYKKEAEEELQKQIDNAIFENKPIHQQASELHSTDFNCPFCKTNNLITSRKEKMETSWLLGSHSWLEDIFKCEKCKKEFTEEELHREKNSMIKSRSNYIKSKTYEN